MAQLILLAEYSGAQPQRNPGGQHWPTSVRRSFHITVPRQGKCRRPVSLVGGTSRDGPRERPCPVHLKLLDLDFRQPEPVTVTGLGSGQPRKRVDRNNHVLRLHRLCQRDVQVRGREAVRSHCFGPVN
jgi:hypothetical protein